MEKLYYGRPTVKILNLDRNSRRRLNYTVDRYHHDIDRPDPGVYQSVGWADAHSLARRLMSLAGSTFQYQVLGCFSDFDYIDQEVDY